MSNKTRAITAVGIMAALAAGALPAAPDWSKAPAKKITLFYPGTSSLEWTLWGTDHSGAKATMKKETCAGCHDQEAADIGQKIVSGALKALEAKPVKGKPGSIPITVQAAHDGTNLYVRVQWKDTKASSGKKMDEKSQVKVAMMFDAGQVRFGTEGGCWASCHHDLRSMPDVDPNAAKHPKAKALDIQDNGPTKYLRESRTELELRNSPRGGWNKLKPDAEIEAALKAGQFLDMIQFRSGGPPREGYVLDARRLKETPGVAEGKLEGDTWAVTFIKKLAGGVGTHKLEPGKIYTVGIAIHDDYADLRYHHVSVGYTLALDDSKAYINAVKQ
jgi:hypothetical protein